MKKQFINKNVVYLFFICYLILFFIEMIFKSIPWMYDAADYWTRGSTLFENGFDFSSIDCFRGYAYPIFLAIIKAIGDKTAWYIINPALISGTLIFFLDKISNNNIGSKKFCIKVIVMTCIIGILFAGIVAFPLSDFWAMICMCFSVLFVNKWMSEAGYKRLLYSILAGVFAYLAYNIRTIYLFSILFILLIYIFLCVKKRGLFFSLGGFGIGCFIAGIPQMLMNYSNLGKISIAVPTNGLMLLQIFWGIKYQRYDTYIAFKTDAIHTMPQCYFLDPVGNQLLEKMGMTTFTTWGDYLDLVIHYPIDVLAIYVRHLVNFIFPCWPQIYIENLNSIKWPLGLLGVSILFLGVYVLISKSYKENKYLWLLIPIVVPALFIIPGAVEYRFSLGIYFYFMFNIIFNTDWKNVKEKVCKNKVMFSVSYLIVVMLCIAMWSSMLIMESVQPLLL